MTWPRGVTPRVSGLSLRDGIRDRSTPTQVVISLIILPRSWLVHISIRRIILRSIRASAEINWRILVPHLILTLVVLSWSRYVVITCLTIFSSNGKWLTWVAGRLVILPWTRKHLLILVNSQEVTASLRHAEGFLGRVSDHVSWWIISSWSRIRVRWMILRLSSDWESRSILTEWFVISIVSRSRQVLLFFINQSAPCCAIVNPCCRTLMSNHWLILVVSAWSWNVISWLIIGLPSYLESWGVCSKGPVMSIISRARLTVLLLAYKLSPRSASINSYWRIVVLHYWLISIIAPRTRVQRWMSFFRSASDRNLLSVRAKWSILGVVAWAWLIHLFFAY